jgi:hypothetical protein
MVSITLFSHFVSRMTNEVQFLTEWDAISGVGGIITPGLGAQGGGSLNRDRERNLLAEMAGKDRGNVVSSRL